MIAPTKFLALALAAGALSVPTLAEAGAWQRHHPARAQINHRIARQQVRITHEVRQGDMSRPEARVLRKDLRSVRTQQRAYAQANGNNGHLTRPQVIDLNRQLNQTSRRIGPWRNTVR